MTGADLRPAAQRMAALVRAIPDDRLHDATPCEEMNLATLLDHVDGFTMAFTVAATKDADALLASTPPRADAANLAPDWRERIPRQLDEMAQAWRDPAAWNGMTRAGGLDLPAELAGVIALDELVVHGWDVARATGQPYDCDEPSLEAVERFVEPLVTQGAANPGLFGPPVAVPDDASRLDRVIGMTGRDPNWKP